MVFEYTINLNQNIDGKCTTFIWNWIPNFHVDVYQ